MRISRLKKAAVLCIAVILLAGCQRTRTETAPKEPSAGEEGKIRIGITFYSLRNEFTVRIVNAALDRANELGVELVVYDGNYDSRMQIPQVEEMLKEGVDEDPEALKAVQNRELAATFFQGAEAQGVRALEILPDCIEGREVGKNYWIDFEEVTPEFQKLFTLFPPIAQ